jgi:uncharacterized membrane protein
MNSRTRTLLLVFAVLGLGAALSSTYVHYRLVTDPTYSSACDISSTVSCTDAYLSRYGSFWGVPVAIGGVIYFALVLVMTGLGGRRTSPARENVPGYLFALSTVALAFVLYLAWASFFQLKAVCILCVTTYVAVIAIFIISGGSTKFPMTTLPRRALRDAGGLARSPAALLITVLLIGGAAALISIFPGETASAAEIVQAAAPQYPPLTDAQRAEFERWWDVQPKVEMPIDAQGAKVLVVKFNDFQCPPCRLTYNEYKGILAKYTATGNVKYVLKHFALDPECNPSGGAHAAACEAAGAYVLARPKGTAEKLEAWFFANQGKLTPDLVKQGASQIAGISDFDAQYQGALAEVRSDIALASKLQVSSTPTFFINGRKIGAVTGQAFEAAIELELRRSR